MKNVLWAAVGLALAVGVCGCDDAKDAGEKEKLVYVGNKQVALKYVDLVEGSGREARKGDTIDVHYVGTLTNGAEFDSSRKRNEPFSITLGAGEVIKGWDEGIPGMKEGGKRKLIIPPELGYGPRAMGDKIPANSTLVFEVELLKVK